MATQVSISQAAAMDMLAECFGADPAALAAEPHRDAIPGWDSMGALLLMAELDERFELELTAEASRAMRHIDDILAFLRNHGVLGDKR